MMTLAALLDIGINLLFVALILITLLLLVVILMQRPKQEGLGAAFGSALTDQAFGARTTDVLKKATVYLGTFFMVSVLVLAILLNKKFKSEDSSFLQDEKAKATQTADQPGAAEPKAEENKEEPKKSVSEIIKDAEKEENPAIAPGP